MAVATPPIPPPGYPPPGYPPQGYPPADALPPASAPTGRPTPEPATAPPAWYPPGYGPPPGLPPPPSPLAGPPGPAGRRRRGLAGVLVAVLVAGLAALGLASLAVHEGVQSLASYSADLTTGHGDFDTAVTADIALTYAADGYHAAIKRPGWVVSGVVAPTEHAALAAEAVVTGHDVPAGAQFGTFVLASPDGAGFAFTVESSGTGTLYRLAGDGTASVLMTARTPALDAGTTRTVMLTCVIQDETTKLGGYVDGRQYLVSTTGSLIASSTATGLIGYSDAVPAEWSVARYARHGPDDLPADALIR